jgi:predicted DNA binding CopG/RHH family protein
VINAFRKEAKRRNLGYQTLINEVLAKHVNTSRKPG